jgi:DnaJ-domain-containing protein 1
MAHLLPLVAGLLMIAGTHASDVADRSMHRGFLSKYLGSDASKTSLGDYNKFMTPRFNHMKHGGAPDALSHHNGPAEHAPATVFGKSADPTALAQDVMAFTSVKGKPLITKDFNTPKIADEEEERAMQKVPANHNSMPIRMSAIGVSLLTLAAMLGVRMRRGLQQATAFASSNGHESDMSITSAPAAAGNMLELKPQESAIRGQVGWSQQSSKNSRPLTPCYATTAADEAETKTYSPYQILGVRRSAKPADIKKAYRERAKMLHPDVVCAKSGTQEVFGAASAKLAKQMRAFLHELDAESTRADLERDLLAAAKQVALLGEDRRSEIEGREALKIEATENWQTVVDAYELLSNEKKRSNYDRKQTVDAVGSALGTIGIGAMAGLGEVAKVAAGAVNKAIDDGESSSEEAIFA